MENGFIKLCMLSELKENEGKRFIVDNPDGSGRVLEVALFLIVGEVFAVSNICPHQHTALIYDGFIEDGFVICPAHGWMFNLKTGKQPTGARGLDIYPVKVINDEVFIMVKPKEMQW
jgi:nitrite reductase/ring-hydroxylating ferredoxin subunit